MIRLWGKDVLDYLNRISTNRIDKLEVNKSVRTIFANEKGRIIDSVLLCNFGDYQLLIGTLINSERLLSWINRYIITEDIRIENKTGQMSVIRFIGNKADELTRSVLGSKPEPLEEHEIFSFAFSNTKCNLIREKDFAGYKSFLGVTYVDVIDDLNEHFTDQNRFEYPIDKLPVDYYEFLRVINRVPNKNELSEFFTPNELELLVEVDFKKGCYVGQEVIARLETYNKVQRGKVLFKFTDKNLTDDKFLIYDLSNNEIGKITSIAMHPADNGCIGLGVLRKSLIREEITLNAKGLTSFRGYKVKLYNPEAEG